MQEQLPFTAIIPGFGWRKPKHVRMQVYRKMPAATMILIMEYNTLPLILNRDQTTEIA